MDVASWEAFGWFLSAALGLAVGSYANVVIYRSPRDGMSSFRPLRSFCPACGKTLAWHDNMPVISWVALRGRCRHCKASIGWRYPLVELVIAAAFVAAWWLFTPVDAAGWLRLGVAWYLAATCVMVSVIDQEHTIIPDGITKSGIVAGLVLSWAFPALHQLHLGFRPEAPHVSSLLVAAGGLLAGGGSLWLVGRLGNLFLAKAVERAGVEDAMGWGDVKWMALAGTFLGAALTLDAILLACFLGAVVGLLSKLVAAVRRAEAPLGIPFGPFLSIGILIELVEPAAGWSLLRHLGGGA